MPKNEQDDKKRQGLLGEGAQYLSIGTETFVPILIGALVGYYLIDQKYGTSPTWTVILSLLGFLIGMYNLFKIVLKINKKN
jgi:F0F1-type ATP synthase assembly protein I